MSTKTGYAVIKNGKLYDFGLLRSKSQTHAVDSIAMVMRAKTMANLIKEKCDQIKPDKIYVEQTNAGRFRMSQKELEFIHFAFLDAVMKDYGERVVYVDTSGWRSELQIKLNKNQRLHNKKVRQRQARGKITTKHLSVWWVNQRYGLKLKIKDNDVADAICVATYGQVTSHKKQLKISNLEEAFRK